MTSSNKLTHWCVVVGVVYVLLVAIDVIGSGFSQASGGRSGAQELFAFAKNPFVGVLLGIMATALVQSSSTVTSIIVGMVAGGLPVSVAIPMVMGANLARISHHPLGGWIIGCELECFFLSVAFAVEPGPVGGWS